MDLAPRARLRLGPPAIAGIVVEVLLSFMALFAGRELVVHPDGSSMGMTVDWLKTSPFSDYFLPGLLLMTLNGLLPLAVVLIAWRRHPIGPAAMATSGIGTMIWVVMQLAMVRLFHPIMHPLIFAIGAALTFCAYRWWRAEPEAWGPDWAETRLRQVASTGQAASPTRRGRTRS